MTSPMHARDIKGKGRYYGGCTEDCPLADVPDPGLMSVTNAQSVVAKPALVPAAVKVTAAAAWDRLTMMVATSRQPINGPSGCEKKRVAERCGRCRFCITAAIKAEHRNQWDKAADFGSEIHTHAYQHNIGAPRTNDPDIDPFIDQYVRFLDRWQVDWDRHVEAAETTVFDLKYGYAGTGDIWLQLPTGPGGRRQLWLVDIKTSRTAPVDRVYPDQELQLAGLRYAPKALLPGDIEVDVPKFAGAALLNLRADDYQFIPLPTDRAAHKAFLGAVTLQRHFHSQDTKAWTQLDAPSIPAPARKAS